jgi:hypothetical protein
LILVFFSQAAAPTLSFFLCSACFLFLLPPNSSYPTTTITTIFIFFHHHTTTFQPYQVWLPPIVTKKKLPSDFFTTWCLPLNSRSGHHYKQKTIKIDTGFVPEFCYLQSKSQKTITAGATEDHRKSFVIF